MNIEILTPRSCKKASFNINIILFDPHTISKSMNMPANNLSLLAIYNLMLKKVVNHFKSALVCELEACSTFLSLCQ